MHIFFSTFFFFSDVFNSWSKMPKTRERMYPDFGIPKPLEHFKQPPCEPPKGREVLERFFDILYKQPVNNRSAPDAAFAVAVELRELWERGDARIPLRRAQTLKKTILDFRQDLKDIQNKSKENRPSYQEAVSLRERERE